MKRTRISPGRSPAKAYAPSASVAVSEITSPSALSSSTVIPSSGVSVLRRSPSAFLSSQTKPETSAGRHAATSFFHAPPSTNVNVSGCAKRISPSSAVNASAYSPGASAVKRNAPRSSVRAVRRAIVSPSSSRLSVTCTPASGASPSERLSPFSSYQTAPAAVASGCAANANSRVSPGAREKVCVSCRHSVSAKPASGSTCSVYSPGSSPSNVNAPTSLHSQFAPSGPCSVTNAFAPAIAPVSFAARTAAKRTFPRDSPIASVTDSVSSLRTSSPSGSCGSTAYSPGGSASNAYAPRASVSVSRTVSPPRVRSTRTPASFSPSSGESHTSPESFAAR